MVLILLLEFGSVLWAWIPNGVDTSLFDPTRVTGEEMKFKYDARALIVS